MKKFLTVLALLMSAGVYAGSPAPPKDMLSATSESLIIFYKTDCPYCQNMNRVLDKEGGFVRLLEDNFSVQRVNIETEEGRALADRFNVHAVPSIIRYNAVSGENSVIKGFPGIQKLAAILNLDYIPIVPVAAAVQSGINIIPPVVFSTTSASEGKVLLGCGDGIIQAGEQCDDGNVTNGDGCSSTCQVQLGYNCSGTPSVCTTNCGDGIKAGSEQCDDGNVTNGDGCSSTCQVQTGYFCTGSPSVCATICGDGIKTGAELCDDGNVANGDGCGSTCNVESGYSCSGSPSVCTPNCGDGIKTGAEQCDDGNTTNGDGCTSTCTVQAGYFCTGSPSVCAAICGDGIVAGGETCDDGNTINGDGCGSTCNTESGYTCSGTPSVCVSTIPPNDNCSGAITLTGFSGTISADNSTATNPATAIPACNSGEKDLWYKFTLGSPTAVVFALNGVSMTDPILAIYNGSCASLVSVICDDDSGPGLNSLISTTLTAGTYYVRVLSYNGTGPHYGSFNLVYNISGGICGDGAINAGEECDDANTTDGDGCSSICKLENASTVKGVAINREGVRADPSAMLDVKSTESGVLIPRMNSTQRTAIVSPAKGLLVFDITTNTFWYYKTGTGWTEIVISTPTTNIGFGVTNSTGTPINTPVNYTPTWPTELYDDGNNFASNIFTAPQAGLYQFTATYTITVTSAPAVFYLTPDIRSGASVFALNTLINPASAIGTVSVNVTGMAKLAAGATVYTTLTKTTAATATVTASTFNGYRVY